MANTKISALPAASTPLAGTEVLPIVQGGITEQVSVANLTAGRAISATQLTSTVAIGTAPLVVTSTTNVANLNASSLNGATFAAPGAIGGGTAAAGSFTTLSASSTTTLSGGTANGVAYLNGSKVVTTGSAITFDGTNLGIGTISPAYKLDVVVASNKNIVAFTPASSSGIADFSTGGVGWNFSRPSGGLVNSVYSYDTAAGAKNNFVIQARSDLVITTGGDYTGAVERARIDSTGIVTMSAYGAGAATFSAAGVISSVSDETWKIKDGAPVDTDAMLKKLEPGYWYYNDEKAPIFGTDRQLGFYAQNVNAAIGPEAAPIPEEGKPWGYYDRSVLAVTVMSLQKALATIESLTTRLAALEAK
jgi:hypothetical protein